MTADSLAAGISRYATHQQAMRDLAATIADERAAAAAADTAATDAAAAGPAAATDREHP